MWISWKHLTADFPSPLTYEQKVEVFYEQTLGLIYKPKPWLWVRPEARYDWAQFCKPFDNNTKSSQFTLALDVILLF